MIICLQISRANVPSRLTAVRPVDWCNFNEAVLHVAHCSDSIDESRQSRVAAHGAIIGSSRVILNLLDKHDVRSLQIRRDVVSDSGDVL